MSPRLVPVPQGDGVLTLVKTLGDPVNVEIVRFLASIDAAAFGDIMSSTKFARATLAKHLRALQDIGVVVGDLPGEQRAGRHVRYSLNRAGVEEITRRHLNYMLGLDVTPRGPAEAPTD